MSDEIKITKSCTVFAGRGAVDLYRMMTLASGLQMETRGMRLTRGRTCYAIIKEEFGLKGNKAKVLAQFLPLVEAAKGSVPITVEEGA